MEDYGKATITDLFYLTSQRRYTQQDCLMIITTSLKKTKNCNKKIVSLNHMHKVFLLRILNAHNRGGSGSSPLLFLLMALIDPTKTKAIE